MTLNANKPLVPDDRQHAGAAVRASSAGPIPSEGSSVRVATGTPDAVATSLADTQSLLSFEALTGGYHDTPVLRELDGEVTAGRALGVLGRNGVGKSTLLRLLAGYLRPFSGEVYWRGEPLGSMPTHERNRLGITYAPQENVVFDDLSVRDNLLLHLQHQSLHRYVQYLDAFPRLSQRLNQRAAGTLSGGEKKLLSFVRALAEEKPLVLLDEPTEGVQQENIELMARLVQKRLDEGAAFLIVEQNLTFLQFVMDDVLVLDHGRCVASGPAQEFTREALAQFLQI